MKVRVKQFSGAYVEKSINEWLEKNPEVVVVDIKISSCCQDEEWMVDALLIYKEG